MRLDCDSSIEWYRADGELSAQIPIVNYKINYIKKNKKTKTNGAKTVPINKQTILEKTYTFVMNNLLSEALCDRGNRKFPFCKTYG